MNRLGGWQRLLILPLVALLAGLTPGCGGAPAVDTPANHDYAVGQAKNRAEAYSQARAAKGGPANRAVAPRPGAR